MRVAVIGSGGIGLGYAAYLSTNNHAVKIYSPSGHGLLAFAGGKLLTVTGIIQTEIRLDVAKNCAAAIDGAEVVILAGTANSVRSAIEEIAPHLRPDQIIIISSHLSFSSLYLAKLLFDRGVTIPIVAWSTTYLTARRTGPSSVNVSGIRSRIDLATLPIDMSEVGLASCQSLFGDRFMAREDVLSIMLSNLNPPVHMANMLCNLTRAEKGEDWANYGGITAGVGNLIEALDKERLGIANAFGLSVRTVEEHFAYSFDLPQALLSQMAQEHQKNRPNLLGPKSLNTRFIMEDVPFGAFPIEQIGLLAGCPVPVHTACIEIFSAIYKKDFRKENNLTDFLRFGELTASQLPKLLRDGWNPNEVTSVEVNRNVHLQ